MPQFPAIIDLAALTPAQGFRIAGAAANDFSDISVASAGDVNGDGFADLIVGASGAVPLGRGSAGASYVLFGKASGFADVDLAALTPAQGFRIAGAAAGDLSGGSVASAGDVNGDGFADLIVGSDLADPLGRGGAGASYVLFGKASGFADVDLAALTPAQGFRIAGAAAGDFSGFSVASAGDVNGDGRADLIVGADRADPNGRSDAGTAYVILGQEPDGPVNWTGSVVGQTMVGGAFDDVLSGLDGDDRPIGEGGADVLIGGVGADQLYGQDGSDAIGGEAGADVISGGLGDDALYGNADADVIGGDEGADVVSGGAGADQLYGGAGNDIVVGDAGDDVVAGEAGNDELYGDGLPGETGNDVIAGGEGNDRAAGGLGNDQLYGEAGDDILGGAEGADILVGGAGADQLYGEADADTLLGGEGDDLLLGGAGDDLFVFTALNGADRIVDFAAGAAGGDVILLDGVAGVASFEQVLARAVEGGGGTTLAFDNGSIFLDNVARSALTPEDFLFTGTVGGAAAPSGGAIAEPSWTPSLEANGDGLQVPGVMQDFVV